jgi:hypothetical protein
LAKKIQVRKCLSPENLVASEYVNCIELGQMANFSTRTSVPLGSTPRGLVKLGMPEKYRRKAKRGIS